MSNRRSSRVPANFEAEIIYGTKRYKVTVENFSENGILINNSEKNSAIDFTLGTDVDLEFELISPETLERLKEKLKVSCKVVRTVKTPDGVTNSIGLEILERSLEYEEFLKIFYAMNMWNISG